MKRSFVFSVVSMKKWSTWGKIRCNKMEAGLCGYRVTWMYNGNRE